MTSKKQVTLIINDEVNCKFTGLDPKDARALVRKFEVDIPGAKFQPSVRLGRWNGKASFFSQGGSTYINLLDDIIPFLNEKGYDLELKDNREYALAFETKPIDQTTFQHVKWPKNHRLQGEPIVLRDDQIKVVNDFLINPQSLSELATGFGKTIMTAALSYSMQEFGRTIIIVPNTSLVTQTYEDFVNLGLDVGVYHGEKKEFNKTHTICTWQSLNVLMKENKELLNSMLENVVAVMVDEAHGTKASVLQSMLNGPFAKVPYRWGFTGTIPPDKHAQMILKTSIGEVINKVTAAELQEQGKLAQCHIKMIQLQDDIQFKAYQNELKYLTENDERLSVIASQIKEICKSGNTLVLVDRIMAGTLLQSKLKNPDGTEVPFIQGVVKTSDRKDTYDLMAECDNLCLIATFGTAAVGINIGRLFNVVLFEPGKSYVKVIQSIGRGVRKAHDKDFVQIWDFSSSCKFSKRHALERRKFYTEAKYPYSQEKLNIK